MNSTLSLLQNFLETLWTWILPSIFKILLIIVIAFLIQNFIRITSSKFRQTNGHSDPSKRSKILKRAETLSYIIHSSSRVVIISIAIMMILNELGLDTRPIIASAGILGVAFSLGAQNLMKDVINGFFILFEDQFGIGDIVKIGDHSGIVERMNLRTTTLKDSTGNIHIVPNSQIDKVIILSQTSK